MYLRMTINGNLRILLQKIQYEDGFFNCSVFGYKARRKIT